MPVNPALDFLDRKQVSKKKPVPDPEQSHAEKLTQLQTDFGKRAEKEEKRRLLAVDSEFWCCLCFSSREQVEEFITKIGMMTPENPKYLDGREVARKLKIQLETPDPEWAKPNINKSWLEFL